MKKAMLVMMFAGLGWAQTTVNGGRTFKGALTSNGSVSVVDFSGAGSTAPVKTGTSAARPTACTQGQVYFSTDVAAGQNLSFCTTTGTPGTWTQMSGGGGATATSGAGSPAGSCTPPALYVDTTNQLLWFCSASNTWKKPVPDNTIYPTLAGPNSWTANNNLASGQLTATGGAAVVDFTSAASTVPARTGALASRPTACTQGQVYFATDASAGQNLYFCTTTGTPGTWTQMSGSGGGVATSGAGSPAGSCTPPALYVDTTNQLLWFCSASNTWKKPVPDNTIYPTLAGANTWTGYNNAASGQWRPPEATVSGLPAASANSGKVFLVTDAASAGSCGSGGGTTRELCRSNGTSYECVGNCGGSGGGGSPGGSSGQLQVNSSGAFGGQAYSLTGGAFQRGVECATGTTSYSALTANAVTQEVTIVTAVPAKFRFTHMLVQEAAQFVAAGVTTLAVSAGRAGVDTDVIPLLTLKQATAPQNYWYDRPGMPVAGTGTYDLVLQFTGSSALGTGSASNFSAGTVNWEVCGFAVQ